ncbi:tail fiber protein [Nemorincola caseinilytica]|uniref:Tail fiber protein n=1 Tax=Nemorincola caseinilytica TaxID=2054315 RepID=A0ABP8NA44_9BACT
MDFYLSQIILWALNWVPEGWAICNGQQLSVNQYQALYSLLGNQFGGDTVNFNLPDLRGRLPIGYGQGAGLVNNYAFSKKYGAEANTIAVANMPAHNHTGNVTLQGTGVFQVSTSPATYASPAASNMVLAAGNTNAVTQYGDAAELNIYGPATNMVQLPMALNLSVSGGGSFTTSNTGGSQPIPNIPPVLGLTYAMCISGGIYPVKP